MKQHAPSPIDPTRQDAADEAAFSEFARGQDEVQLQAALWAAQRSAGLNAADEALFQTWMMARPVHAEAYAEMERSFRQVRRMPRETVALLKAGLRDSGSKSTRERIANVASPERRGWLSGVGRLVPQAAMAMAVLATVGGGWLGWGHWRAQPVHDELYVTQRGQRMSVDLPDGSRLQLDAATRMEALLYRDRREVRLVDGQVMFNVHSDAERPFDVLAGHTRVTVVGTRFSVRHAQTGVDAGKTVVQVESGRVRVAQMGSMSAAVELGPGMAVTADEQGRLERTVSVAPNSVGAWRAGRVSFSDTPLLQALAEFERYGETRLMVRDPAVAAMRVGGSFDLREVGTFAQALPLMLPVKLKKLDAATEIVPVR